jgi:hypothetical protein
MGILQLKTEQSGVWLFAFRPNFVQIQKLCVFKHLSIYTTCQSFKILILSPQAQARAGHIQKFKAVHIFY